MDRKQMAILALALVMVFALGSFLWERPGASASLQAEFSENGGQIQLSMGLSDAPRGISVAAKGLSIPSLY